MADALEELEEARGRFAELVRTAMATGRSVHLGPHRWDRAALSVAALEDAIEACAAFPHPTAKVDALRDARARLSQPSTWDPRDPTWDPASGGGDADGVTPARPQVGALLEEARLVAEMRAVLMTSSWGAPASWSGLADFLDSIDYTAAELEEIQLARLELTECREALEAAVRDGIATGRSQPPGASQPANDSTRAATRWSHEAIATEPLTRALAELRAFPRLSDDGRRLVAHGDVAIQLRTALRSCDWDEASSWTPLVAALELLGPDVMEVDEVVAAWRELSDMRASTEAALRVALASGRSVREGGPLGSPQPGGSPRRISSAERRPSGRLSLDGSGGVGGSPPNTPAKPADSDGGVATPRSTPLSRSATRRSVFSVEGSADCRWSHASIGTDAVTVALAQLRAFPKMTEGGLALGSLAEQIVALRRLLLEATWDEPLRGGAVVASGWASLARWLDDASRGPYGAEEEVRAAMQELSDKRAAVLKGVREAMALGRSVQAEEGRWSHEGIQTTPLQEAVAELEALVELLGKLSSSSDRSLCAEAMQAVAIRQALTGCDWSASSSWGALATLLEGVATELLEAEEVVAAWQEFHDMRAATEAAVQAALDKGRSTRLPAGGWTHEGMGTEALRGALAELEGFPRMSDRGRALAARGALAMQLRGALLESRFESAASWSSLAQVLAKFPASADERLGMSGFAELADARAEFECMREATEQAVLTELERGKAVRVSGVTGDTVGSTPTSSAAPTAAAALAATWDHSGIETAALAQAASECELFPKQSERSASLVARSRLVVSVREALLESQWGVAQSWSSLIGALELGERLLSAEDLASLDEVAEAYTEFDDAGHYTELVLSAALQSGRSVRQGPAHWEHGGIAVEPVTLALREVLAFPRPSDNGRALAAEAQIIVPLRRALLGCDWAVAASWAGLAAALDAVAAQGSQLQELASARAELLEKQEATVEVVRTEMGRGACVRRESGGWDFGAIETAPLEYAVAECAAFPRPLEQAATLLTCAQTVIALRRALQAVDPSVPSSWRGVASLLQGLNSADELALPEVCAPVSACGLHPRASAARARAPPGGRCPPTLPCRRLCAGAERVAPVS